MRTYNNYQCVWTTSKSVEYHHCDRNFDCDGCEFDRRMREKLSRDRDRERGDVVSKTIAALESERFETFYKYLPNGLFAKPLFGNAFYIGVSPTARHTLDNVTSVRVPNKGKDVGAGETLFRLEGEWGSAAVVAPIDCRLVDAADEDKLPDLSKWIGLLETDKSVERLALDADGFDRERAAAKEFLSAYAVEEVDLPTTTMFDGGERAAFLYQAVGAQNYLRFLEERFGGKTI